MKTIETDVLVIGAGGAGLSAAVAATSNGAKVVMVDDNPDFGGQIWRKSVEKRDHDLAQRLFEKIDERKVIFFPGVSIVDKSKKNSVVGVGSKEKLEIRFESLVIATGARERFLPFPGWTLPNVYGAGGLQALVKSGFDVSGKRIIVSGTGPLLPAVAEYLKSKGADVPFIAEQVSTLELLKFGMHLVRYPSKWAQTIKFTLRLGAVSILRNASVVEARGSGSVESIVLNRNGRTEEYDCDILATGFHLLPNLELPSLFRCDMSEVGVSVDEYQRTSVENVYAAGETTGIGGVELACVEGEISGHAATGHRAAAKSLFGKRKRFAKFADTLNRTFAANDKLKGVATGDMIVCRCEDVTYGRLAEHANWREAKLQTRCGMGPCQGRVCGPATNYFFDWKPEGVQPPLFPVKLSNLGE